MKQAVKSPVSWLFIKCANIVFTATQFPKV